VLTILLTIENVVFLFIRPKSEGKEKAIKKWELIAIFIGATFSLLCLALTNIVFYDWNEG
jgi:uncharacterized membrane protein YhdT